MRISELTISLLASLALMFSFATGGGAAQSKASPRPNLILFISDDHTATDCGPYGATDVKTPHLNRLAAESLKFTRAFAASPSCAPSRSSIYSGLFPMGHGAHANHAELKPQVKTLPHYLKPLGYETALIGKVHVKPKEQIPFDTLLESSRKPGPDRRDAVTLTRTLEWLAQRTNSQPFCLVVATHEPHVPWELEERFGYRPQDVGLAARSLDTPETRAARTAYYSDITRMDEHLGQLLDAVEQRGLLTNTVFVYAADQGAQWPFAKWGLYDAGLHVPLLVRWPGLIKPGTTTDALVSHVDLLATFIELAGGRAPDDLDSQSFLPVLNGQTQRHREAIYAAHTADGHMNIAPMRCVRTDRYKYILNLMPEVEYTTHVDLQRAEKYWASWEQLARTNAPARDTLKAYRWRPMEELFDVTADPAETKNLAADPMLASVLRDLRGKMSAWRQEQHDADVGLPADELNQRLARNQAVRKPITGTSDSPSAAPASAKGKQKRSDAKGSP